MSCVGIIPARYASTRFPGKVLAPVAGLPMIQRVWQATIQSKHLNRVMVATDDPRIAECCEAFGAAVVFTSPNHPTGTDRVAEVAQGLDDEVIVNVQADEAMIQTFVIDAAVEALLEDDTTPMATVVHEAPEAALDDPNRVKVVLDHRGFALYFSRARLPALQDASSTARYWQHAGVYVYRRSFLLQFAELAQTPAERAEGLEQLRALENGFKVRAAVVEGWRSVPIDVPEDVKRVEALLTEAEGEKTGT
ncbi:MAG: 3-deoxy-manno-octulosonate cytidylyltransferase [Myxococcota bacterium]